MTRQRRRGDNIPPVSDYSHWNEDAERVWYEENRYDMEHADEIIEDDDDDRNDYEEEDDYQEEPDEIVEVDDVSPMEDDAYENQ